MARVNLVQIEDAKGLVKEVYESMQKVRGEGKVSNLFKGFAIWPELLEVNWKKLGVLLNSGNLSRKLKESIAVGLAIVNGCEY